MAEVGELALVAEDEEEAEVESTELEAEVEAGAEDDEELDAEPAHAAPDTILPVPHGIAGPSGCLALGGDVTAPFESAMAKRVVQVGSSPPWVNWKK